MDYTGHTPYSKTVALMEELGLDVRAIVENDFDTTGYWELVYDDNGKRILDGAGGVKAIRHQWPSQADALRIVDQYVKEKVARL